MIDAKALFGGFRPAWTEVPQTVVSGAAPHPAGQYRYSATAIPQDPSDAWPLHLSESRPHDIAKPYRVSRGSFCPRTQLARFAGARPGMGPPSVLWHGSTPQRLLR